MGADSPLVHNTDGQSDRLLAYVIYTTCRSCYLVVGKCELDTLPSITHTTLCFLSAKHKTMLYDKGSSAV